MLKYIQTFVCVAIIAAFAVSCQSGNNDVREAARENVENQSIQPAAQPQANPQQAQPAVPAGPTTSVSFSETTFDFGTVTEGELVSHTDRKSVV